MNNANANHPHPSQQRFEINVSPERAHHWSDLQLSDAAVDRLAAAGTHDTATLVRLREFADELQRRIVAHGALDGLALFVADAQSYRDALDRFAAIHTIEFIEHRHRTKGQRLNLAPIDWPGWSDPDDPHRKARLLTDLEFGLVRAVALAKGIQFIGVISAGEAGAVAGELGRITAPLVEVDTATLLLPGGLRGVEARTAAIPTWGLRAWDLIVAPYGPDAQDDPVLYRGESKESGDIQSSLSMNSLSVFRKAGLGADPAACFGSLQVTAARRIYDLTGSTDAAVAFLGARSHDSVRTKIGLKPAARPRGRCGTTVSASGPATPAESMSGR